MSFGSPILRHTHVLLGKQVILSFDPGSHGDMERDFRNGTKCQLRVGDSVEAMHAMLLLTYLPGQTRIPFAQPEIETERERERERSEGLLPASKGG